MLSSLKNRLSYIHFISFGQAMTEAKELVAESIKQLLVRDFLVLVLQTVIRFLKAIHGILVVVGGIIFVSIIVSTVIIFMAIVLSSLRILSTTGADFTLQVIRYYELYFSSIYGYLLFSTSSAIFIIWWNMRKAAIEKVAKKI